MRTLTTGKWSLEYTQKALGSYFDETTQLTEDEQNLFKENVSERMQTLENVAKSKFDDQKNWSIMIKRATNEERNEIMKRLKDI